MGRPAEFSFRSRAKNLEALTEQRFDLIVVGGGITGAGVARDAALRGLSVAVLVREASTERYAVRKLAPHLAQPAQMIVPVSSRASYAKLSVGLWTYDRLASVAEEERYRMLSREETLALEPRLRAERLYGAGAYYEYVTDDARLVIEVVKSAVALGVVAANYAEVEGFVVEGGRVSGVEVRDHLTGDMMAV